MASVLQDPVHIDKLDIVRTVHQALHDSLCFRVTFRRFTLLDILVHPVPVDMPDDDVQHALGQGFLFIDACLPEINIADCGHRDRRDDCRQGHQQNDFQPQGTSVLELRVIHAAAQRDFLLPPAAQLQP